MQPLKADKKGKQVEIEEEKANVGEATKPEKAVFQKEYTGDMRVGMSIVTALVLIQVMASCIFIWWTKQELIFSDRIAPKFVFDCGRAFVSLGFAVFWI